MYINHYKIRAEKPFEEHLLNYMQDYIHNTYSEKEQ